MRDSKLNERLRFWKGRKIVSVKEFHSEKILAQTWDKVPNYFPDDYMPLPFLDSPQDKTIQAQRQKWWEDYLEFLTHQKNPNYGKIRCA
ncbi:MAG TPA: hypothetical protein VLD38_05685, partial [Nitrosopumilaceae archaeon]|nr:hypothetical protein [Nitrosopumilaceae archaeon]